MRSISAVTDAFATASQTRAGQGAYTPHSARHTLAALGQAICLTPQARKAWSLNLGHESEAITWTAYGQMSARTKTEVLGTINSNGAYSDEEKDLMLDYLQHKLTPGTPEFRRARKLARQREEQEDDVVE